MKNIDNKCSCELCVFVLNTKDKKDKSKLAQTKKNSTMFNGGLWKVTRSLKKFQRN